MFIVVKMKGKYMKKAIIGLVVALIVLGSIGFGVVCMATNVQTLKDNNKLLAEKEIILETMVRLQNFNHSLANRKHLYDYVNGEISRVEFGEKDKNYQKESGQDLIDLIEYMNKNKSYYENNITFHNWYKVDGKCYEFNNTTEENICK